MRESNQSRLDLVCIRIEDAVDLLESTTSDDTRAERLSFLRGLSFHIKELIRLEEEFDKKAA